MSGETPTDDLPAVLNIDWEAVEADVGREIDDDLRAVIEHEGSTSEVVLDPWGYADKSATDLFAAVEDHSRLVHPDRGPLDPRYASKAGVSGAVNILKALRGDDLRTGTIIEGDAPDEFYLEGVADLYDVARELDGRRDDWFGDRHPQVSGGSYGPDRLGDLYVHLAHEDQDVVESIDVSDLPVEPETIRTHEARSDDSTEEHYTATFRHERYYSEDLEPTIADERAEEIGYLGANAGKQSVETDFTENGYPFEEIGEVELGALEPTALLYEYEKTGETRYAVEWTTRTAINDDMIRSLIFDREPDQEDVATALTIEQHREGRRGVEGSLDG